jgi:SAM-dependent methyltransferase
MHCEARRTRQTRRKKQDEISRRRLLVGAGKSGQLKHFFVAWIERFLRAEDVRIVDFGAGTGLLAQLLERHAGKRVRCLEPAENMKAHLPDDTLDSLGECSADSLDFIYSSNVLEHIEDDKSIERGMCRTLRPGGRVFLYLPAFQCLFSALDRKVGHYRRYDKAMVRRLFPDDTWKILSLHYADSLGFAGSLWFKAFGKVRAAYSLPPLIFYDRVLFPLSRAIDWITQGTVVGKNILFCAEKL